MRYYYEGIWTGLLISEISDFNTAIYLSIADHALSMHMLTHFSVFLYIYNFVYECTDVAAVNTKYTDLDILVVEDTENALIERNLLRKY